MNDLWKALKAYQPQADLDGHGESWRVACEKRTIDALDVAIEDAGEQMQEADPTWELLKVSPNHDYDRIYTAGEAMINAVDALKSDFERQENINMAIRLIERAQEIGT